MYIKYAYVAKSELSGRDSKILSLRRDGSAATISKAITTTFVADRLDYPVGSNRNDDLPSDDTAEWIVIPAGLSVRPYSLSTRVGLFRADRLNPASRIGSRVANSRSHTTLLSPARFIRDSHGEEI